MRATVWGEERETNEADICSLVVGVVSDVEIKKPTRRTEAATATTNVPTPTTSGTRGLQEVESTQVDTTQPEPEQQPISSLS